MTGSQIAGAAILSVIIGGMFIAMARSIGFWPVLKVWAGGLLLGGAIALGVTLLRGADDHVINADRVIIIAREPRP